MAFSSFLFVLCFLPLVCGHGLMSWPRQRGLLAYNNYDLPVINDTAKADYCPHCLSGGGVGAIAKNTPDGKWTPYEPTNPAFRFRDDHGICGDAKGNYDHMRGGVYTTGETIATYERGDYVDFEVHISAHHNGFFDFFVCNMDACDDSDISKKCFQENHCYKLMRVPHKSCESGWDRICGPVDQKYPGRWYLPPRDQDNPEDNWYGGLNKKMRYALPEDLKCERCVIHWAWTTANSCNPPGYAEYKFPQKWEGIPGDGGSVGGINRVFETCGKTKTQFPEEFWSCAENVRIVEKGQGRTLQKFHNGEMNVEGPRDKTSDQLMKPYQEPKYGPEDTKPSSATAKPDATTAPEPKVAFSPEPSATQTPEPQMTIAPEGVTDGDRNGSRYDLSDYVSSFDTGLCTKNDEKAYCEACLDLGYGVRKCLWCTIDSGQQKCVHYKPE